MVESKIGAKNVDPWDFSRELPNYIFQVLRKSNCAINPVMILGTVDSEGRPNTAPFGSLRAVTPNLLRFACSRHHSTCVNICQNPNVSVAVLNRPDIAVSIKGRATAIKERMDTAEHLTIFKIEIQEVKNDMVQNGFIKGTIGFTPHKSFERFYIGAIKEIENMV